MSSAFFFQVEAGIFVPHLSCIMQIDTEIHI